MDISNTDAPLFHPSGIQITAPITVIGEPAVWRDQYGVRGSLPIGSPARLEFADPVQARTLATALIHLASEMEAAAP